MSYLTHIGRGESRLGGETDTKALREEVRRFLAQHSPAWSPARLAQSWVGFDREFSLAVGKQGWIGMTWPERYGGGGRSWIERYTVLEEMLAAGAPVGAHWTGDRQTGPLLLKVGTEAQKEAFLPRLARGEISVCIGLSEPDTGSDLASLRSRARRVEGGWLLDGRKLWTTNAHHSEYMLGLFRTGEPDGRANGLSQFLIDLAAPGVEIRGIHDLSGEVHFNEVTFDGVRLADDALVGTEGEGWKQVTSELAFERSGPDRYMSDFPLFSTVVDGVRAGSRERLALSGIGDAAADIVVLREMSLGIAEEIAAGESPVHRAALLKDLGVAFEQRIPEIARRVVATPDASLLDLAERVRAVVPTYSIRGGTTEIMRGIIAKGLAR